MNRIGDYALIGDCHSAALVGRDGSIDWACFPRFDSPAVFAKVLDAGRGGSFSVSPERVDEIHRQYVEGTNVLQTMFHCASGDLLLTDCMPVHCEGVDPRDLHSHHAILRRLECTDGTVDVRVAVEPRFEYGRFVPFFRLTSEETGEAVGGADAVHITATRPLDDERERIRARWHLRAGETVWIEAAWSPSHRLRSRDEVPSVMDLEARLEETIAFWRGWADRCIVEVADVDAVRRSALTLKALAYAPTGAVIAARRRRSPSRSAASATGITATRGSGTARSH